MITLDFSGFELKLKQEHNKTYVFDPIRKKWVVLTPEEHVRQYLLQYLLVGLEYPRALVAVEKKIMVGKVARRFDIAVYDNNHQPWMLIECKEPGVRISEETLFQLLSYHRTIPSRYWVLSCGRQTYCANANDLTAITWMDHLPLYER
jgi:hypothetical protein